MLKQRKQVGCILRIQLGRTLEGPGHRMAATLGEQKRGWSSGEARHWEQVESGQDRAVA